MALVFKEKEWLLWLSRHTNAECVSKGHDTVLGSPTTALLLTSKALFIWVSCAMPNSMSRAESRRTTYSLPSIGFEAILGMQSDLHGMLAYLSHRIIYQTVIRSNHD